MIQFLRKYWYDSGASLAAYMALTIPILVGSIGMATDVGMSYLVRARLQGALDAAALATAAATSSGDADIGEKLDAYFEANYPPEKIGVPYDLDFTDSDEALQVSAMARYNTMFVRVLGIDEINIAASTTITRAVRGIEAVLVLDNTGSMSNNNNIQKLRDAAETFVNTLYDRAGEDEEYVKIGIVPYSSTVNVGRYGLGLNPDGSAYGDPFVTLPNGVTYNSNCGGSSTSRWCGCVLAENYPGDVEEFENNVGAYLYRSCSYSNWTKAWTCTVQSTPNRYCPPPITPLTSDREVLLDAIDDLRADGNTLGNFGMIWGYRVVSPEFPFEEGAAWDDYIWRKAVVMMTDGDNTIGNSSFYSAYGWGAMHGISTADINDRFEEVCALLRSQGVLVYTIVFTSGINEATKDMYRACATTSNMYYYAPSGDDLEEAFEKVARELSNLHVSN